MTRPTKTDNSVTLSAPVRVDGKDVTEITIREPKAGEMRGLLMVQIAQMDTTHLMKLLPRITVPSLSEAQLSDLRLSDFFALSTKAVSFLVPPDQLRQFQANI